MLPEEADPWSAQAMLAPYGAGAMLPPVAEAWLRPHESWSMAPALQLLSP